eukprot:COSAG05_NODE_23476_length_258_cov_0.327044_1_plen_53_part_01
MKNKKIQTKEEKKAIKNQDKLEIIALKALSSTELINTFFKQKTAYEMESRDWS